VPDDTIHSIELTDLPGVRQPGAPYPGSQTLDVVVPVYNEADGIASFHAELIGVLRTLRYKSRIIYVNDGSTDDTAARLRQIRASGDNVEIIELSRNFGHQAALTAGLDTANANRVLMMDGDGQHPASLIPEMIGLAEHGYDIVQTQRIDSAGTTGLFKKTAASMLYRLIAAIGELEVPQGAADFRLMSRSAVLALRQMPEYHRFLRGMVYWIGFRSVLLPYQPRTRIAGSTKYTMGRMLRFASDGVFSFSLMPLKLAMVLGGVCLVAAMTEAVYVAALLLRGRRAELVPGWTSLILVSTTTAGMIMLLLGIIGIYIGMIFQEVRRRPVYLVRSDERDEGA
jgi:polyisoprenyl-phosphate glycosyltransferase